MTLPSLWTVARPTTSMPPAEGAVDVVVVGGGLTGLVTSLLLARGGKQVMLLESGNLGGGTTGRSTAKVSVLQGTRLSQLARRHDPETVAAYLEAGLEGQAWLRRFCEDHGVSHQERTAYTYATTPRGSELVDGEFMTARSLGLPVERAAEIGLPFVTKDAVLLPAQYQVHPGELVGALAREASGHGAVLVEQARVRKVRGTGPVRISGDFGEVSASAVVVATNYPYTDRAGHFSWFTPQRSYALAMVGANVDGMFLSADGPTRSLRNAPAGGHDHLLVGGEGHVTGRTDSPVAHLDRLRRWTEENFPGTYEVAAWSAQDYSTANGLPWIGPLVPGVPGLVAAGGYAKWGFSTATAAALALSGDLLGGRQDWAKPLQAWSPRMRGAGGVARALMGTGIELTRGWGSGLLGNESTRLCTHLGGPLKWNDAEASWDCPLHGSRFAPDGSILEGPARCELRGEAWRPKESGTA